MKFSVPEHSIEEYFSGKVLIGDDYSVEEIEAWFKDEREAYANLGASDRSGYKYHYHPLNAHHAFRFLPENRLFNNACGFGSAYGDELLPIMGKLRKLVIIDSSCQFNKGAQLEGIPTSYAAASPSGALAFKDKSFDLITCFGVLHHIPNVSFVLTELTRCLSPGGILLLREPTTTMGDWRRHRHGLTTRERGIPHGLLRKAIDDCGLTVIHESPCIFPPLTFFFSIFGMAVTSNEILVRIDHALCRLFSWNYSYHRTSFFKKFAPASNYFVCCRPKY